MGSRRIGVWSCSQGVGNEDAADIKFVSTQWQIPPSLRNLGLQRKYDSTCNQLRDKGDQDLVTSEIFPSCIHKRMYDTY